VSYKIRNYRVIVSYEGGMSTLLDRAILKAVHGRGGRETGVDFEGSGYGFGLRDMSFIVPSRSWAQGIRGKLSKIDKRIRVECEEAYQ
jgi:hypothetical protein